MKMACNAFGFERSEETLDDGIVVVIFYTAHAKLDQGSFQATAIGSAGELAALIAVMEEPGGRAAVA